MMTGVGIAAAHTLTNPPAYLRAIIAGGCGCGWVGVRVAVGVHAAALPTATSLSV